jgi:H+-transporting ATPase
MAPLGWKWAGFVWAYALAWALLNDRVKLLAYRIFDPTRKSSAEANTSTDETQAISTRAYAIYQQ